MQTELAEELAATSRSLAGKSAVITGSTSGIGLGIAKAFAAAGAHVMLNGLPSPNAEATRQRIERDYDVMAAFSSADMSMPTQITDMFIAAVARFGKVDILVNTAGVQHVEAIEAFPP